MTSNASTARQGSLPSPVEENLPRDLLDISPRRILMLQLRQIGDALLATPSAQLLRQRFPQADIDFVTEKKCAPVLEHNPHITRVVALDKKELGGGLGSLLWYWRAARRGYDLVVDFQQLPRCRFITAFSGAKVRLSYDPPWYNRFLYTHTVKPLPGYAAFCKASLLRPLGVHWRGEKPRIYLTEAERVRTRETLASFGIDPAEPLVTLDPSHRRATRRWPAVHFARLADLAAREKPGLRFLALYGPGEEEDARRVAAASQTPGLITVPDRVLGLREMAGVIEAAALHVGNCSAPRHFAVALDTPSLTLLGATSAAWTYPGPGHEHVASDMPCQSCNLNVCPKGDVPCLQGLLPETALAPMLRLLNGPRPA